MNGSEAFADGVPPQDFTFTVSNNKGYEADVKDFFALSGDTGAVETWSFDWFEDLFVKEAGTPSVVNVASTAYRGLELYEPGEYTGTLNYWDQTTVVHWTVHPANEKRMAKNVILFIGDGMPQSTITAARLLGHKQVNGKYDSLMQLDQMDALGHQMTHSLDSFITDSANSATAILSGHKTSVNALGVYADSSPSPLDDPKFETLPELYYRQKGGKVGIVSTADITDATPASNIAHTRSRDESVSIAEMFLTGVHPNYTSWPEWNGPEVLFGGGAEQWIEGPGSPGGRDYYQDWRNAGYQVVNDKDALAAADNSQRTLGLFSQGTMALWLDRNIYPEKLNKTKSPTSDDGSTAENQPGLADMTLKAIDILNTRAGDEGFFLMSEAASVDKALHGLNFKGSLGELLELDDTIKKTVAHLESIGILDDTLIVVTADHAHGFDVLGNYDTWFADSKPDDEKNKAIGGNDKSGSSEYQVAPGSKPDNQTVVYGPQGPGFPVQWDPRYEFYAQTSTLGKGGVHSLQDVPVYAKGQPEAVQLFRGVYQNTDIFFKLAKVMGLGICKPKDE